MMSVITDSRHIDMSGTNLAISHIVYNLRIAPELLSSFGG